MKGFAWLVAGCAMTLAPLVGAYPIFGSEDTGMRRLEYERLVHRGVLSGNTRIAGEMRARDDVQLRMLDSKLADLPEADTALGAKLRALLDDKADNYSLAVLDISDPAAPRYAEWNGREARNPGSVGKLVVATAFFDALAAAWPDVEDRRRVLRESMVEADDFVVSDHHTVRLFNVQTQELKRRPLEIGDTGNLYDWLDWMMSASSNSAAAMMMREAMLLRHFGRDYPLPAAQATAFFKETSRSELADLLRQTMDEPLTRSGLDLGALRQGSMFTRQGKKNVAGTSSYATARELARFLLKLEQGLIVDAFSSLEIKRLLYVTERRIRYASSPALREDAVFFKSGSFYQCVAEEGFTCKKYMGNKNNLMNSVAIVESGEGAQRLHYLVALTSNVLKRNSAVDHQTLATRIHRIIQADHGIDK